MPESFPFTLFVNVKFSDEESENTFLNAILPYCKWVKENEPNTLEYKLMKSDKEERGITYGILERYADKERDFLGTHRNSSQFAQFRKVSIKCMMIGRSQKNK